jgi:PmbA protein
VSVESLDPRDALVILLQEARAAGAQEADAIWEESESLSLDVFESKVQNLERSDSAGLGLRVLVDGKPGYSFTERLASDAVRRCARDAVALARFTDPLGVSLPESVVPPEMDLGLWNSSVERYGPAAMLESCLAAEAVARDADPRIVNIPHLGASRSVGRTLLANSKGFLGERRSGSASLGIGVVAREDGIDKMGWDGITWRDPARLEPQALARRAVERSVELLGAHPVPSGAVPVLFDERVSGQFLSIFLGSFLADAVQKGQSRLVGRVGERVAPRGLHLSTQPHLQGMAGTRRFDGEGVPTKPRRLVDDGILQGFLHNLETASRDGLHPTGDAVRNYTGRVSAGFSNLQVDLAGGRPRGTLETAFPRLLHVVKLEGSTGCNPVSGDLSIGVQGFLVEGSSRRPVDRISLSGNIFDLLSDLEAWGDSYRPGVHSQFVPALLARSLQLAS